jgi:deoxyuridine 5'-triphosphate nucleotidohydrolase
MNRINTVKFLKVRDVKTPIRGTDEAAGIDFFVPNYNEQFEADFKEKNLNISIISNEDNTSAYITIPAHCRVLIPSGIKTWLPVGTALIAANKSGVASKKGLIFGAQVVDSDYAGEVHISVINTTNASVTINTGDKLIQFIHTPVLLSPLDEVDAEEFERLHSESLRGEGGFGSTGTK